MTSNFMSLLITDSDNDSDGRVDEDCGMWVDQDAGSIHAHNRAVGHEFMVMFLENQGSAPLPGQSLPSNELFITSALSEALIVRVISPGLSIDFSRSVPASSVARIDISSSVRMAGTSRGNNGNIHELLSSKEEPINS